MQRVHELTDESPASEFYIFYFNSGALVHRIYGQKNVKNEEITN